MSFSDNYFALEEEQRKKKKKKEKNTKSQQTVKRDDDDIAPLFVNKTAPLYSGTDIFAPTRLIGSKPKNNTAPVVEQEEEERKWFEKGAFEDGYQFGDVTKTILGTETDIRENLMAGVLGMGEKIVDAGAYVAGGVGGLFGADKFKDKTKDFIKKDLYDEEKIAKTIVLGYGLDAEKNSVLGEKSDSLAQSGGQLAATVGLQAVGVPWFVTSGVTSFGAETESALNDGATFGEAGLSAAISAGAEILTEKISGGISFGGKTLDDALTKRIARGVSDKTVRALTKLGLDMAGEGTEEVLSGVMSAVGQKITYADDKELTELFSKEDALESFIGGAVLGGAGGGVNAINANRQGVDSVSGLTANEQKVVDKVFEQRVAEEEKSGKLTQKKKDEIYDQVIKEMEKGYLSTDTIEEVLGGDTFKTYKDTVDSEDALRNEFDTLNKMKQGEMTGEQIDRRAELKQQLEELKNTSQRNQLKSQLGEEVFGLVKGDRLVESYNERGRKRQAFEADLTKYDEKQKTVVQKAIDSGILNNTNRTHEFVDLVAKISADKGVLFDFTDNAKLKESGFAVDGKSVNGYVTKDGITLNVNSEKMLEKVVGHEVTHILEGTELYKELQSAVVEYAKTKNDYQGRYDALSKLYEGIEGADVDAELTADLVGDYLFTDPDFINSLSTNHRNVFQKIYDEVKYLVKVATAGSKEARELEKVKRAFENAYKEGGKVTDTKYSLTGKNQDGIEVYETSQEIMDLTWDERKAKYLDVMKNEYRGRTAKFERNGHTYYAKFDQSSVRKPIYGDARSSPSGVKALIKAGADGDVFDLVENSKYTGSKPNTKTHTNADYFDYFVKTVQIDGKVFDLMADVEKEYGTDEGYVYTLALVDNKKIKASPAHGTPNKGPVKNAGNASGGTVSQPGADVNRKYSVSDKNIKDISTGYGYGESYYTMTYTQDGKVVGTIEYGEYDGNPNVKMVEVDPEYRRKGIATKLFQELQKKYPDTEIDFGMSTPDGTKLLESITYDVTDEAVVADRQKLKNLQTELNELQEKLDVLYDIETPTEAQIDEVEKFGDRWNEVYDTIRELEQSLRGRRATKTFVKTDTKYSLSDSDGKQLTKEQQDYFKDSKMRDENGNLKVMYHGSQDAGFHIFDAKMSDDETSFFFVDRNDVAASYSGTSETYAPSVMKTAEDVERFIATIVTNGKGYDVVEEDGKFSLYYKHELVADSDSAQGIYEEFCDFEGVGYGDANYKVYLNLKNPLEVDAEGRNWNNLTGWSKAANLKAEDATVKRVGDEFRLYKNGQEIENASIAVNQHNQNMDTEALKSIMVDKVNSILSITTEGKTTTREIAKWAKEHGYDGVIFKNIHDNGGYSNGSEGASTVAIAFDSNQIKSVANEKPTSDPDIRYSLSEDSEGRKLSDSQSAYFKGSKVVDENGKLKVVYHGSPKDFNTFSLDYLGTNGTAEGYGFYFTDSKSIAENYSKGREGQQNGETGRLFEVYLDIKKPLSDTEVTMSRSQFKKFLTELNKQVDADGERLDVLSNYGDVEWEGLNNVLNYAMEIEYDGSDSDVNMIHSIINGCGDMKTVFNVLRKTLGYDGIIVNEATWGGDQTIYIAFHPEQIKNVSNQNPTSNPDIRRSLSNKGEQFAPTNGFGTYGKDIALNATPNTENALPNTENVLESEVSAPVSEEVAPVSEEESEVTVAENATVPVLEHSVSDLAEIAKQARRENMRGAYTHNGKQYLSDGSFIAEFDTVDESLEQSKEFPIKQAVKELDEAFARRVEGNYDLHTSDTKGFIKVGNSLFGSKRVNALIRAIENPVFSISNVHGGNEALVITGDNGRAVLMPVRASGNAYLVYEAQPVKDSAVFPDDLAPIAEDDSERFDSLSDADAPPETEAPYYGESKPVTVNDPFEDRDWFEVGKDRKAKAYMYENPEVKPFFQQEAINLFGELQNTTKGERWFTSGDFDGYGAESYYRVGGVKRSTSESMETMLDMWKMSYEDIEKGLNAIIEDNGAENIAAAKHIEFMLNDRLLNGYKDFFTGDYIPPNQDYINLLNEKQVTEYSKEAFDAFMANADDYAPLVAEEETTAPVAPAAPVAPTEDIAPVFEEASGQQTMYEDKTPEKITRAGLHQNIVDGVKAGFKEKGFDFDKVLRKAKNLSTFSTVDNTPQRVMEKALGYKEGQILSDLTVNKVAQNETEGTVWLNEQIAKIKQFSKKYHIKPGSKESAAAQMYAEGFYVNENNEIISYGDAELAKDFPNPEVRANIKGLAKDARIRQIYDETLAAINESRTRNAYPEIPRLDNYFLHFRAMEDTFSRLGLPFNPNDIRAKDLPTDLNGVTADLKPGQPFFASSMQRKGKRTSFDLLGGLERYLSSAKNQIYHIDDIQTLRALRNYIADTYGQARGLENLDTMSEEESQERIKEVYDAHLSTFAKFLNEEANVLAGKTALIDRGIEGWIGRRGMTFLDTVNKQVGSNMVGFNVSSSLTNFLSVAQAFAKSNKAAFVKAFAQTVSNKISSIYGKADGFAEQSPVMIRRKGADRFYRTPWQKAGDIGYTLMSAVDNISTELIARTKYNEFVKKGMDAQKAHIETDKWVSRLMGDRSLGQMPLQYNSKFLNLINKFQLEVRNQLDSQFYDTIQETKVSNEHIENKLARNAKTAAKVTAVFFELAVAQHLFGKAFESVAGYNPAFDIISVLATAFGFDDDEDSEDTALDNIGQGFLELLEDLPYTSTFTGGRIPISAALPDKSLFAGKDKYGNDVPFFPNLFENAKNIAPYYAMPGGYSQIKKTVQGLRMFSDDHPIAGSYTESGNLRFPVEDTLGNKVQAGIFGQYASGNARDYFDNERSPLKEKQIQEFIDVDIPIRDYWEYREGLSGLSKLSEKADYISELDLPIEKKNILLNNIANRKEDIDMTGYEDYDSFDEFDFAVNNPEKYEIAQTVGGYEDYMKYQEGMKGMKLAEKVDYVTSLHLTIKQKNALINGETDRKEPIDLTGYDTSTYSSFEEFEWAKEYPENYAVAKAVGGYDAYKGYSSDLYDIKADKDSSGKSITGSRKEKVADYINGLDADYYTKIILFKSEYPSEDSYNYEIIEYLNGRNDISYEETVAILKKLGFEVDSNGNIYW